MNEKYFDVPIEELGEESLVNLIDVLESYKKGEAWQFMRKVIERDLLAAAMGMAQPKQITIEMLHFQRGAMYSSQQLMSMPDKILMQLNNALLMKRSNPAMAGKE